MKKFIIQLVLFTAIAPTCLFANETTIIDVPQYNIEAYKSSCHSCCIPKPHGFLIAVNSIFKAHLTKDRRIDHSRTVQYAEGQVAGLFGYKLDTKTGYTINLGAGIVAPQIKHNPHFSENSYSEVNAGLSAYTAHFSRWFIQVGFNAQIDANKNVEERFAKASRYSALVWGRYAFERNLGLHAGLIFFTGITQTTAYPILGIDYTPNCHWNFNLVFPIYPSITYNIDCTWSLSLSARPFIARVRLANHEFRKNGIFEYRNIGTELSLDYNHNLLVWSIHGGYTYGGSMQIRNSNSQLIDNLPFDGAPYVGVNLLWRF